MQYLVYSDVCFPSSRVSQGRSHQHSKSSDIALLFTKLNNRISQLNVDELLEIFSYLSVRDCIRLERGLCIESHITHIL